MTSRTGWRKGRVLSCALIVSIALSACSDAKPTPSGSPTGGAAPPTGNAQPSDAPVAAATHPANEPSAEPTEPTGPSARNLISAAYARGQIDYPTSLRYRAAALLGLAELPEEFVGAEARVADSAVFEDIAMALPSLAAADQASLQRFILRPTEPGSIFSSAPTGSKAAFAAAVTPAATSPPIECRDWVDSGGASTHFKVWACVDGDPAAAASAAALVVKEMDGLWADMTKAPPAGMGPPIADGTGPNVPRERGGDGRIDVYVLAMGEAVYRGGANQSIPSTAVAAAVPSPPWSDDNGGALRTSSGFMLVNKARLNAGDKLRSDLIHEFFHVLQKAHNRTGPLQGETHHWFGEASAVWAEWYYLPRASAEVHTWFETFQDSRLGLESTDPDHTYAAYIWPFFMQQEKGATAIFKAWVGIEGAGPGDFKAVSAAISAQVPFATDFRDFAVRNLNHDLTPLTPPDKRYADQDRANFPEGPSSWPVPIPDVGLSVRQPAQVPLTLEPLSAAYFRLAPDDDARYVTIDLSRLSPAENRDGDVLLHIDGKWVRRPIEGDKLNLCRDDRAEDFDEGYLVLSNHGQVGQVSTEFTVRSRASCGDLTGTITWSLQHNYNDSGRYHITESSSDTVTMNVRFANDNGEWRDDGSSYSWTGTGSTTEVSIGCTTQRDTSTTGADSFDSPAASITLYVDREARMVYVSAIAPGRLTGHVAGCGTDEDYAQGGGSSFDSRAEWVQVPRCNQYDDALPGKIAEDGKTVDFACSSSETSDVNTGKATDVFKVSGTLTFKNPTP